MLSSYIQALETRARWILWIQNQKLKSADRNNNYYREVLPIYEYILNTGDSYFMDHHFCDLVHHARMTIPDDLKFENSWMQTPSGFLVMEDFVVTPDPIDLQQVVDLKEGRIRAIGWYWIPAIQGYQFAVYMAYGDYIKGADGFGCWSHFAIREGDDVITKIREFEEKARIEEAIATLRGEPDFSNLGGYYANDRQSDMMHEIRWIYTAMHLMSLRLTHVGEHRTSSLVRQLAKKKRLQIAPMLKVVTLRRMQEAKPAAHSARDWQWQWRVEGHWRLQPYKSIGDYRWKFIESYLKGPADKPIKPYHHTVFVAKR